MRLALRVQSETLADTQDPAAEREAAAPQRVLFDGEPK